MPDKYFRNPIRTEIRQFIMDRLGEHPEGLTSKQLLACYGPCSVTEKGMVIDELMCLRVHYWTEPARSSAPEYDLLNRLSPSRWLEWARAKQDEEEARDAQPDNTAPVQQVYGCC